MFVSPPLPYPADALEPAISATSVRRHYDDNQAGYFRNTNQLIAGKSALSGKSLLEIALSVSPDSKLGQQSAQAWAHVFWWDSMTPTRSPRPAWVGKDFDAEWVDKGAALFGSGWLWLVIRPNHAVGIEAIPNAMLPQFWGMTPLLVMDLWEHAYYCQYGTARKDYLRNTLSLLNWNKANSRLRSVKS